VAVNPNDTEESIWAFLCEAQLEGPEAARQNMLKVASQQQVVSLKIFTWIVLIYDSTSLTREGLFASFCTIQMPCDCVAVYSCACGSTRSMLKAGQIVACKLTVAAVANTMIVRLPASSGAARAPCVTVLAGAVRCILMLQVSCWNVVAHTAELHSNCAP
jgi:hypothetical protein